MMHFGSDNENNKVQPIVSNAKLQEMIAINMACFFEVERYRHTKIYMDFEALATVNYADVLKKDRLRHVTEQLIENDAQYDEKELNYLVLRNLINCSWRLDAIFLIHLEDCIKASQKWGCVLRSIACEENLLDRQPYWLRNEQLNLLNSMDLDMYNLLSRVEVILIKSKKAFTKCSSTGAYYFVHMDRGLFSFLVEWIRVLLSGYRISEFNRTNEVVQTTEPIKTGALLIMAIVGIVRGGQTTFILPNPPMNFSPNDYSITKEIVTNHIEFLLGHEYGHIYAMENKPAMEPKEEEIFSDIFSFELLKNAKTEVASIGNNQMEIENDIQSENELERKGEDIELLFLFYDLYFYASRLMGYDDTVDDFHPTLNVRRELIRKNYTREKKTPLLDYAESVVENMKGQMREQYERD